MFICQSAPAKNSNASSWEDYIPQILTVLLEILRVYIWSLWPFVFCLSFILSVNQRFWPDSGHILRHQYGISVAESQTFLRAREVTAFSWTWFSNVLLRLLPTLSIVLANSSSATLSCTCFWIFLPSGIHWGEETDVGRQRLKWALESLFTFALLVFRTKQGTWHKRIQLTKASDFPSFHKNYKLGPTYPRLARKKTTISHVKLCENYIKRARLLWGLKQVLVPVWFPGNQI